MNDSTETLNWLLSDHLGSSSITTNADGSWNSEIRYSAFGETRYSSGITPTDYRYTGQLEQKDVNLYYYNARYYDAALGRFIQADTIIPGAGDSKSYDRYAYVNNNPVRYTDPSGNFSEEQLTAWYGYNYMDVIANLYSDNMQKILMSAEFGDLVTYESRGYVFGGIFAMTERGGLMMWDVGTRRTVSIENFDKKNLVG